MAFQTLAELNTGDVLPETWVDQVKENFESLRGSAVTSLPTGYDNQVVRYKPNGAGSAPTWMCVFDADLNGGAGAWAYVGGAPLTGFVVTQNSTSGTAPSDLSTPGPSIAIPCAGDYTVRVEADMYIANAASLAVMSVQGPGVTSFSDPQPAPITGSTTRGQVTAQDTVTFTGAGTVICKYQTSNASHLATFQRRRLTIWPIELRP